MSTHLSKAIGPRTDVEQDSNQQDSNQQDTHQQDTHQQNSSQQNSNQQNSNQQDTHQHGLKSTASTAAEIPARQSMLCADAQPEGREAERSLLLDVRGLKTWFHTREGVIKAVDGIALQLKHGEILGLVGESGSGKSITGFSLMGLVDQPGRVQADRMHFNGHDLQTLSAEAYRRLRGADLAMIFQDPMMTLNPTLRVDTQMIEAVQAHDKVSRKAARARSIEVLNMVGIPSPAERMLVYPHHLSGGMRQRIAIAIALLNRPKLIIADEPTTALDVTIQGQILYEVQKLCREMDTALIWITHDLAIVSGLADRLAVMYAGRLVETGPTAQVVGAAQHPYTQGLIDSIPSITTRGQPLFQIPGSTPSLLNLPEGCPFQSRCYRATAQCRNEPELEQVGPGHWVSCWHKGVRA